jgi:hypothetical protein
MAVEDGGLVTRACFARVVVVCLVGADDGNPAGLLSFASRIFRLRSSGRPEEIVFNLVLCCCSLRHKQRPPHTDSTCNGRGGHGAGLYAAKVELRVRCVAHSD